MNNLKNLSYVFFYGNQNCQNPVNYCVKFPEVEIPVCQNLISHNLGCHLYIRIIYAYLKKVIPNFINFITNFNFKIF